MVNDIFKSRNCLGCVSAALNIYSANFTKIFRATWMWITAMAVISGATAFVSIPSNPTAQHTSTLLAIAGIAVLWVLAFVISARSSAGVIAMLNGAPIKKLMGKVIKANVFAVLLTVVTGIVVGMALMGIFQFKQIQKLPMTTIAIIAVAITTLVLIVAAIAVSPFTHSISRYIFMKEAKFKDVFGANYHKGFRRLGFLFSICIVVVLISFVACLFLCIPAIITNFASSINSYGVASGDASGLPGYFAWLNFLSTALMAFIMQYLMIWIMFTLFYAYGSIETDSKEDKDSDDAEKQ